MEDLRRAAGHLPHAWIDKHPEAVGDARDRLEQLSRFQGDPFAETIAEVRATARARNMKYEVRA
jgi:hypothetical protein